MKVDLYQKYKSIALRAHRDPRNSVKGEMRDIAKSVLQAIASNDREIALRRCERLVALDAHVSGMCLGNQIFQAIKFRAYKKLVIPPTELHKWQEQPEDQGFIYVARANDGTGILKIGASRNPRKSVATFNRRYSASMIIAYQKEVRMPFRFEKLLHKSLERYRESSVTKGISNELFQLDTQLAANAIETLYQSFENEV